MHWLRNHTNLLCTDDLNGHEHREERKLPFLITACILDVCLCVCVFGVNCSLQIIIIIHRFFSLFIFVRIILFYIYNKKRALFAPVRIGC